MILEIIYEENIVVEGSEEKNKSVCCKNLVIKNKCEVEVK